MHASLLALLALPLASPALAQTAAPADTTHFYRHHLGLTASPQLDHFFTANRSLPVGLLYKHQTKPGKLWRFGLTLNQQFDTRNDPAEPIENDEYTIHRFGVSVRAGREYARPLTRCWTVVTGSDILLGYSRYSYENTHHASPTPGQPVPSYYYIDNSRDNAYRVAVLPFVGARYYVHKQLYVAVEATLNISYTKTDHRGQSILTEVQTGITTYANPAILHDQAVGISLQPISQITLNYLL